MAFLYLFTFLAGIVTVLSPCVLPVLPAILSAGIGRGRYRPLGVIIGLMLSFAFFTLALTFLVNLFGISANVLRTVAIVIIGLFGIVMLFPSLSNRFASLTSSIGNFGANLQTQKQGEVSGFGSGFLLGCALGLVWTPCAGPILAAVTTLVATQQVTWHVILLTLTYSLGTGIPLFLIAYGGHKALTKFPLLAKHTEEIKRIFGVLMILTAVGLAFNFEVALQQFAVKYVPTLQIENNATVQEELKKLRPASEFADKIEDSKKIGNKLPLIAPAPEITGITAWINSNPLTINELKGKVVLIDFWTYSCINCIRTFPYITDWYAKYKDKGLVIIGVHTPEFEFEKDFNNVKKATERFGILYPVAMDNNFKTWNAYSNNFWPAHYLIDQNGVVRQVHYGEGAYMETENAIRELLGMNQIEGQDKPLISRPLTPEIYLGTLRARNYQPSLSIQPEKTTLYSYSSPLQDDRVGLKGDWYIDPEKAKSKGSNSSLDLNFIASRVYLVMDSEKPQAVTVLLDDAPLPSKYYTADMDDKGQILVKEARKYDVIDLKGQYGRHKVTLIMPDGVSAYAFTFGDEL